jgi:hypothetical protein
MITQELLEGLSKLHGNVLPILLPSGDECVIREQNGEDDAVLTRVKDTINGVSLANFIAGILVYHSAYPDIIVTGKHIMAMKSRDKYYILVSSRVFSLGKDITFEFRWPDLKIPTPYTEDLTIFIPEMGKPLPNPGDDDFSEYALTPYPENIPYHIFSISTGKTLRFKYTDGESEKYLMDLSEEIKSKNSELLARGLALKMESGEWVNIENFKRFNSREMAEIRGEVEKFDPQINLYTEIAHPDDPQKKVEYSITTTTAFFFPLGI